MGGGGAREVVLTGGREVVLGGGGTTPEEVGGALPVLWVEPIGPKRMLLQVLDTQEKSVIVF